MTCISRVSCDEMFVSIVFTSIVEGKFIELRMSLSSLAFSLFSVLGFSR
jgi:hypothetical protein